MNVKLVLISLYIVLVYWISSHLPTLHALFYPTLGAFSFLLASREFDLKHAGRILAGATVAAAIGTAAHALEPGALGLLSDTLLVAWLIHRFRWNAPPILAVSIIPFFVEPTTLWAAPVAVMVSLAGLIAVLGAADRIAELLRQVSLKGGAIAPEAD
ncbi:hypothetical protein [Cohnella sp. GCM10027633]|uniref:hypothetical protein n=1 Tax=unclassified Cohnella TaxID=2636738 RepID=UPI00362B9D7C